MAGVKRKLLPSLIENANYNMEETEKVLQSGTDNWKTWTLEDVAEMLEENGFEDFVSVFAGAGITGGVLPDLTEAHLLEHLHVEPLGVRLSILKLIREVTGTMPHAENGIPTIPFAKILMDFKVFNDPIHGHIEFHPLCMAIIDTPQFQRLRYIRQMGGCYYVFPGATSNRFEHSLGVAHLAGQLVMTLQSRQPELGITEIDILCVIIAGLCHDLGHGPFSHMFDGKFIPAARPNSGWRHEDASVKMFDYLVEQNNLVPVFEEYGVKERDRLFIKEQIAGPLSRKKTKSGQKEWCYAGRDQNKRYLYEIVANKRNGIDVDKWDYFARDCYVLGIQNNFDHRRFMKFVRVIEVDKEMQICSRDKEAGSIYDMFRTRTVLHKNVYQHRMKDIVEVMITEAFLEADPHIRITGTKGRKLKISETIDDMCAYTKMTDSLYFRILYSDEPELAKARAILERIEHRKIYKCVGESHPKPERSFTPDDSSMIAKEIAAYIPTIVPDAPEIRASDLIVQLVNLDYGMKTANPVDSVRFYMKKEPSIAIRMRKDQVSKMLPDTFSEQLVRVYVKSLSEDSIDLVRSAFAKWCEDRHMNKPKEGDAFDLSLTQSESNAGSQKEALCAPLDEPGSPMKSPRVSSTPIRNDLRNGRHGSVDSEPNSSMDVSH